MFFISLLVFYCMFCLDNMASSKRLLDFNNPSDSNTVCEILLDDNEEENRFEFEDLVHLI